MSEKTPKRSDLLGTLRAWQAQDLEEANRWLEENRQLMRDAIRYDREEARREVAKHFIKAMAQYN
jgi:hypothetical protein